MARGTESEFRLEKDLQKAAVRWAREAGWFARRYKGPGRRSHPDYLFIRRGVVVWVEFKLPGNEPTELQHEEIGKMLAHGATVYWLDDFADFKAILEISGAANR
jgi:Holliday junction resolvase